MRDGHLRELTTSERYFVSVTNSDPVLRPRRRRGCLGCLGSLVVVLVLAVGVGILLKPWSLHIGGRFTPFGWTGIGRARTPDGLDAGIELKLGTRYRAACTGSGGGCTQMNGSGVVCTRAGRFTFSIADASFSAWWSLDGRPMKVRLTHGNTTLTRYLNIYLDGTWHGPAYEASDGGYLSHGFNPNGSPRSATGSVEGAEAATVSFQPGDFAALCRSVG
jgi:hypothetical protein